MPGTIVQGNVSTEEVLPEQRKLDFDERMRRLKPDDAQFTTMTDRTPVKQAVREKVNWFEEDDFPRQVTNVNAQLSTDTSMTVTAGQGKIVAANDLMRNMRTGEAVRILSVATDTISIARNIGAWPAAAASFNAGDIFLVVGDAQPQGSDFPTPRYLARVLGYNYTQITRTTWSFTGTQTQIEMYGGPEPASEAVRKAREHKRKWEAIGFFGARGFSAAQPPENEPRGTAGGVLDFIQTTRLDAGGALTANFFDNFIAAVMPWGSSEKVLFASPVVVQNMSIWNRTGMGSQFAAPEGGTVHGVKIDAFISGAYGYRVPVVIKKEWSEFPTANKGFGGYAFLLDMNYIEQRPMRDRDTKLITDQQPKGKDVYSAEYFREATYQVANEKSHGLLYGVTPPP